MSCVSIFIKALDPWLDFRLIKKAESKMVETPWSKKQLELRLSLKCKLLPAVTLTNTTTKAIDQFILPKLTSKPNQQKILERKNLRLNLNKYNYHNSNKSLKSLRKKRTDIRKIETKTKIDSKKVLLQLLKSMQLSLASQIKKRKKRRIEVVWTRRHVI